LLPTQLLSSATGHQRNAHEIFLLVWGLNIEPDLGLKTLLAI
jgi:hypothetical protein